jgi:hypothetical protein
MQAATPLVRPTVASRIVTCLWCHSPSFHAEVVRNRGLCRRCAEDNAEIGWRIVYDRERKIGVIPRNLRVAYGL